jgi:putative aldouronate transport system substrate-binding protein
MKSWSKCLCILLALLMIFSFTACGNNSEQSTTEDHTDAIGSDNTDEATSENTDEAAAPEENSPFAKFKGVELTYWHPFSSTYISSLDDNIVYQELEKITGIKINFITPAAGQENEAFNLMIASGEYPDLINHRSYKGGGLQLVAEGVYLKLNDLIAEHAPNYTAVMALSPDIGRQTKEDDGTIWSFRSIQIADEPSWAGPVIRQDYLDDLGLQMPETMEEWHSVLTAFKESGEIETPMLLPLGRFYAADVFTGTYGSSTGEFLNKDGTIVYGPIEPGFKEFLTLMNQWYNEGLIDKDFATRDDKSIDAQITSGKAGACATSFYGSFASYDLAGKATDPNFNLVPAPYPVINKGDDVSEVLHVGNKNWNNKGCDLAISTACQNVEAAVKWIDYRYTAEGFMLFNYGVEGVSYNWVDGPVDFKKGSDFFHPELQEKIQTMHPEYTDLILNNPDGVDTNTAADKYKGPYVAQLRNPLSYELSEAVYAAMEIWSKPGKDYKLPPLSVTTEEAQTAADYMSQIETYKDEMIMKFIIGLEPLENFDKYVEQIKSMNIDKVIAARQAQLDRFLNR